MAQLLKHPFRTFADKYFIFDEQDHGQPNTPLAATNNIASVKVRHIGMTNLCRKKQSAPGAFVPNILKYSFRRAAWKLSLRDSGETALGQPALPA